jgi:hypothetical protein
MNLHHSPNYTRWKTGVETRLYEFQITQSQDGVTGPFGPSVQPQIIQPVPATIDAPSWDEMILRADKAVADILMPPISPLVLTTNTIGSPTKVQYKKQAPTKTTTFMQGRPDGPVQRAEQTLRSQERQVSTQLQAKGTTSAANQEALATISALTGMENKKQLPKVTPPKAKRKAATLTGKLSKRNTSGSLTKSLPVLAAPRVIERTPPVITHACKYGCCHGGLLDLVQMASGNTKHALKTGNFFYGKTCADCTMPIAELFATSKNKALFYYCTVDFNVAELDNDATVSCAPKPCDCILCITCYFARDTRKQASNGPAMRSSRRG